LMSTRQAVPRGGTRGDAFLHVGLERFSLRPRGSASGGRLRLCPAVDEKTSVQLYTHTQQAHIT
jgi:hypothetical protein